MANKKRKQQASLPFMCLLMIVKNESHIILETLEHLVHLIDYWVVCDTGSIDQTRELITDFFSKNNKPGELHNHEWVNFGHNRTLAFEAARGKSRYVFVFDADDKIHGSLSIPKNINADAYFLQFGDNFKYTRLQIFNNNLRWAYRGVLHEFPVCLSKKNHQTATIQGNYFVESRRLGSRNQDPEKYEKDAALLKDALDRNADPDLKNRYVFYLAQSYKDARKYREAIHYYKMRVSLGGWKDECYYSSWQVGLCMENSIGESYGVAEICGWYLKAAEFCGHRGESLTSLGVLNYKVGQFEKAVFYLSKVKKMKVPADALFCVCSLYGFECEYPLVLALNKIGRFDSSTESCGRLLESISLAQNPNSLHLVYISNIQQLQIYNQKKTRIPPPTYIYDGFEFIRGKDVYGYDLAYIPNLTIDEMISKSREIENCNAFNTLGYFKDLSILCAEKATIDEAGNTRVQYSDMMEILTEKFIDITNPAFTEPVKSYTDEKTEHIFDVFPVGIFIKKT
jgi:glycosyltransferase involved in cell wall biosynthesis